MRILGEYKEVAPTWELNIEKYGTYSTVVCILCSVLESVEIVLVPHSKQKRFLALNFVFIPWAHTVLRAP
jgi:hypothetical protein